MKKIIVLLALYNLIYAGDLDRIGTSTLWLTQGYVFESISGTGFTRSIYNHVANMNGTNPAAMYTGDNIYMGISYQLESVIKPAWVANISHERGHPYLPQSLGIVYPLRSFRIGIGFSQRYNSFLDLGKFEITTVENPDGTGEFWTADKNNLVICYSGLLSYSMANLLDTNDELCLGIQLNYNTLDYTERMYRLEAKGQGEAIGWAVGVRYDLADKFQIGLFYERNPYFNENIKITNGRIEIDPDTSGIGRDTLINVHRLKNKFPDKLNFGVLYRINKSMEMTLEISNIYWQQLDDNSMNSIDISGTLLGHLTEQISLCASLLSTGRKYSQEFNYDYGASNNLDALFLLLGMNLRYGSFDFDIALTTAAAYGDWREQMIGKIALGYHL